ncbi:MAG: cation:dicarboxylase symporter family transporter, partial [Opitutales bacterium]|nr:cation:dicarboxylase symporter family transporter [Opitutales bacterium]
IKSYSLIFAIYVCYAACYCLMFYLLVNKGILRKTIDCLKNMLPAAITALSTMSSAITMPVTILCTEKNVKHKDLASSVISTTTNIHLLGDCLAIPMLAYALLKYYSIPEPTCVEYLVFTIFFVIAKFSVAAVPAGGIIIMTPILEKYLHFTPEMSSLIIAIYMIFDPIVTSFNVLGNGALAKLIDQLYDKFVYRKKSSTS